MMSARSHAWSGAPEVTAAVDVAADGRLQPAAVGWSRRALQRTPLGRARGRRKRWEHWAVMTDELLFVLTLADVDYLAFAATAVVELARGDWSRAATLLRPGSLAFPDAVHGADLEVDRRGFYAQLAEGPDETRIEVSARTLFGPPIEARLVVARPAHHETLNVVVPWSETRFAFTSKQIALRAEGEIRVGARRFHVGGPEAFAALDHGRGVWPWRTRWSWGCGAAKVGDRVVGLNLGAQWTDGTGQTENGIVVGGRLHKIHDPVRFVMDPMAPQSPVAVSGPGVELTLTPLVRERVRLPLGVLAADLDLRIGRWRGAVTVGTEAVPIDGALGWAEEMHARW